MKIWLTICVGLFLVRVTSQHVGAANSLTTVLPPHAQILATRSVPGNPLQTVVVFRRENVFLAVVSSSGGAQMVRWSRQIPSGSFLLRTPGEKGLFEVRISLDNKSSECLLAYVVRGSRVLSAVADHRKGQIRSDEGIRLGKGSFTVRRRDTGHVGSVPYSIVTRYQWAGSQFYPGKPFRVPDVSVQDIPVPNASVQTDSGNAALLRLEIADTEETRQTGLMNRPTLDPDTGMLFVWQQPVQESFWMENTIIPLTVAFLSAAGTIQEMQDMEPLTTTLHTPSMPYLYALEVNKGFFAAHGIVVGNRLQLHL